MPQITISGQVIDFPDVAQSPVWAEAIIQFAEAVESALSSVAGAFDVAPQLYTMVSNANTNVALPSLSFPTSQVQGALITYSVYRTTNSTKVSEFGTLEITYNPDGPINNKWEIAREFTGNAQVTFTVTDTGQVEFSSTALTGSSHSGLIGYTAKALLNA